MEIDKTEDSFEQEEFPLIKEEIELEPLTLLDESLKCDDTKMAILAANRLSTISLAIGFEQTKNELIPLLEQYCFPTSFSCNIDKDLDLTNQAKNSNDSLTDQFLEELNVKEEIVTEIAKNLNSKFIQNFSLDSFNTSSDTLCVTGDSYEQLKCTSSETQLVESNTNLNFSSNTVNKVNDISNNTEACELALCVFSLLLKICSMDETVVRESAIKSLKSLYPFFKTSQLSESIWPALMKQAETTNKRFSIKLSLIAIFVSIYPYFNYDIEIQKNIRKHMKRFCENDMQIVRVRAISSLPDFLKSILFTNTQYKQISNNQKTDFVEFDDQKRLVFDEMLELFKKLSLNEHNDTARQYFVDISLEFFKIIVPSVKTEAKNSDFCKEVSENGVKDFHIQQSSQNNLLKYMRSQIDDIVWPILDECAIGTFQRLRKHFADKIVEFVEVVVKIYGGEVCTRVEQDELDDNLDNSLNTKSKNNFSNDHNKQNNLDNINSESKNLQSLLQQTREPEKPGLDKLLFLYQRSLMDKIAEVRLIAMKNLYEFCRCLSSKTIVQQFVPIANMFIDENSKEIQAILADQISKICSCLDRNLSTEHLLPLILKMFKQNMPCLNKQSSNDNNTVQAKNFSNLNASSVVDFQSNSDVNNSVDWTLTHQNLLRNCALIVKNVDKNQFTKQIIPFIIKMFEDRKQRVRLLVIENLSEIGAQIGLENFEKHCLILLLKAFNDAYCEIRMQACLQASKLIDIFGQEFIIRRCLPVIVKCQNSSNYLMRMVPLFFAKETASKLTKLQVSEYFTELFFKAFRDNIANVRATASKILASIFDCFDSELLQSKFVSKLTQLKKDSDQDVSQFAQEALRQILSSSPMQKP